MPPVLDKDNLKCPSASINPLSQQGKYIGKELENLNIKSLRI